MIDRALRARGEPDGRHPRRSVVQGAPSAKDRGFDAGKKVVGRKRHVAVDADGRLLMANLTTADVSDSAGGAYDPRRHPKALAVAGAEAFDRGKLMDKAAFLDFVVEIVRRIHQVPGLTVLPRRCVVERTLRMAYPMAPPSSTATNRASTSPRRR